MGALYKLSFGQASQFMTFSQLFSLVRWASGFIILGRPVCSFLAIPHFVIDMCITILPLLALFKVLMQNSFTCKRNQISELMQKIIHFRRQPLIRNQRHNLHEDDGVGNFYIHFSYIWWNYQNTLPIDCKMYIRIKGLT